MANINDIREVMWDELSKLRNGETSAANVNAICNAVGKMLSTVKLQMEYSRLMGKMPDIPMFDVVPTLSSPSASEATPQE